LPRGFADFGATKKAAPIAESGVNVGRFTTRLMVIEMMAQSVLPVWTRLLQKTAQKMSDKELLSTQG